MATITLTFDTGAASVASIMNDLADANGYEATINGQPNSQTKAQFAKEMVRQYIVRTVREHRRQQAAIAAASTVNEPTVT